MFLYLRKKMLKAVLFDMDGVIVDTEPLHKEAYQKMFLEVGIQVSDTLYETFTGQATLEICEKLCSSFKLTLSPETLVAIKRRHFKSLFESSDLKLLDGVLELIQEYHSYGLKLVLASSASMANIDRIFNRFDLDRYFIAKVSGADLHASKPHPEIFIRAAQAADHSPEECMVIEDATNGIIAAKAAGIFCVAYNSKHSKNQDYSLANKVVSDFRELSYPLIKDCI